MTLHIYIYEFEDGTNMKIINCSLTMADILALEKLHGECISRTVEINQERSEDYEKLG